MSNLLVKISYRSVDLLLGVGANVVAGFMFRQVWQRIRHNDEAPRATDEDRGWGEILTAAALQGAIFALVRATVDRAAASGVRRVTGSWPA